MGVTPVSLRLLPVLQWQSGSPRPQTWRPVIRRPFACTQVGQRVVRPHTAPCRLPPWRPSLGRTPPWKARFLGIPRSSSFRSTCVAPSAGIGRLRGFRRCHFQACAQMLLMLPTQMCRRRTSQWLPRMEITSSTISAERPWVLGALPSTCTSASGGCREAPTWKRRSPRRG